MGEKSLIFPTQFVQVLHNVFGPFRKSHDITSAFPCAEEAKD